MTAIPYFWCGALASDIIARILATTTSLRNDQWSCNSSHTATNLLFLFTVAAHLNLRINITFWLERCLKTRWVEGFHFLSQGRHWRYSLRWTHLMLLMRLHIALRFYEVLIHVTRLAKCMAMFTLHLERFLAWWGGQTRLFVTIIMLKICFRDAHLVKHLLFLHSIVSCREPDIPIYKRGFGNGTLVVRRDRG